MSDSTLPLVDIHDHLAEWMEYGCKPDSANKAAAKSAIFAYSRHHDPAWKAAREAMELILAASDSGKGVYEAREAAHSAIRLLDGKAVPHE